VTLCVWKFTAIILLACSTHAQVSFQARIAGTVTDSSGAAVPGADVTFSGGDLHAGTVADATGEFFIGNVQVTYGELTIQAQGFESQKVQWSEKSGRLVIVLHPATVTSEVTVSADRVETRVTESATSVVILSTSDLNATAALTTDDTLRQVPGFSLFRRSGSRTANPSSQGVSLRGLGASGASRAVVLADGFTLNDPFGGWVYWDRVPHSAVSSVEVASGGVSHLYGSDALGGVINIRRKPVDQDAISLETSWGNENTPDLSLTGSKALGPWSVALAGDFFRTDGYINVPTEFRGAVDKAVNSRHGDGDLTVERSFGDKGSAFARGSVFGEDRNNGTPLQINSTTVRELDLGADWNAGRVGRLDLRTYGSTQVYDQTYSAIALDRSNERLTRSDHVPAQQLGFSAQWSRQAGTHHYLVAGVEQSNVRGVSEGALFSGGLPHGASDAGGRTVNWGLYAEDMIHITPRWLLTLGGRLDRWTDYDGFSATQAVWPDGPSAQTALASRDDSAFSPRISLLRKVNDSLSLVASGYRAFRAPTLNELYRGFRVGNVLTLANDQLKAERLTGGEAGAIISGWNDSFMLRGNFFWSDISGPVANVTESFSPDLITRRRENLGRTQSRGTEIEVTALVTNKLVLSGGYEFTDATVLRFPANAGLEGTQIPQVPRNSLNFQIRYFKPFIHVGVQGRFVGNAFDDDLNTLPLRSFFTMDVQASHSFGPGIEGFIAAENVLNERYDIGRTPVLTLGPPVLMRVGLKLEWSRR